MNYLQIDTNNNIKGFIRCSEYDLVHYKEAYTDSNFISTELDSFEFDSNFTYKLIDNEIVKEEKNDTNYLLSKVNQEFINSVNSLTSSIPKDEIATWTKQESEARAWIIDNNTLTPLIDAICSSRGVSKEYLVSKIIEKADAYAVAIGTLTGIRQKQEKLIKGE